MKKMLWLSTVFLFFYGCKPASEEQKDNLNYFDVKGYFADEAARLKKDNPYVTKTVMVNGIAETKQLRLSDWQKEFSVFSDVDINRRAWTGLFQVLKNNEQERYTSENEKVPVKEVLILKKNNKPYAIQILIKTANILYSSADTLWYYPDSLYQIKKKQHIRLLSEKNYSITGKFK